MKVFKFGGISIKDAKSIRKIAQLIKNQATASMVIVVSATENTTNALETLVESRDSDSEQLGILFDRIKLYHQQLMLELFPDYEHPIYESCDQLFSSLWKECQAPISDNFKYDYDRIVPFGELLSSTILSAYLNQEGISNTWVDIRKCIKTNRNFKAAEVLKEQTERLCKAVFTFEEDTCYLTQGFIASTMQDENTSLGREGSDFSAALLGNILDAEEVCIWKDVPGILNADPQEFEYTEPLAHLSYQEAFKMAYYGAKVIHPKTIKPLQDKNIPLRVRSFLDLEHSGTLVDKGEEQNLSLPSLYIMKDKQMLFSIMNDSSCFTDEQISEIVALFTQHQMTINLTFRAALQFVLCVDLNKYSYNTLLNILKQKYRVLYNTNLKLYTILHYTDDSEQVIGDGRNIYLQQKTRDTAHYVLK